MANYYTKFTFAFDVGAENVEAAGRLAQEMRDAPEKFGLDFFQVDIQPRATEAAPGALLVDDDAGSDLYGAIAFVKECGKRFGLTGTVEFQFANDCDKARPDVYGGGAVSVDLATGEELYLNTSEALELMRHPEFQETFRQMLQDVRDKSAEGGAPSPA